MIRTTRFIAGLAVVLLTLFLTACGGGGGSTSNGTTACVWGSSNWNQCNWQ